MVVHWGAPKKKNGFKRSHNGRNGNIMLIVIICYKPDVMCAFYTKFDVFTTTSAFDILVYNSSRGAAGGRGIKYAKMTVKSAPKSRFFLICFFLYILNLNFSRQYGFSDFSLIKGFKQGSWKKWWSTGGPRRAPSTPSTAEGPPDPSQPAASCQYPP